MSTTSQYVKTFQTPKGKFQNRLRRRCRLCGRSRAVYRKFELCRLCFRQLSLRGDIPGITKASW